MPSGKEVLAVFPGSFDPITNGHLDVIRRSLSVFSELIVAVGVNPAKEPLFTGPERVAMIEELVKQWPNVRVDLFTGLTVDYVKSKNAQVILRGLRNLTDVQYEFEMALTNRAVADIETVFIMTGFRYGFTTSTLIREIGRYGGDISELIPASVYKKLQERLKEQEAQGNGDV